MKKIVTGLLAVAACLLFSSGVQAAGSRADAETLVKNAISFAREHGKEKCFAEISTPRGRFIKEDVYVTVIDLHGKCLAHGANQKLIGKNVIGFKDPDGIAFIKEYIEVAQSKGKGWVDYKFNNPISKRIEAKSAYVEKLDNMIFSAGVYKK